VRIIDQVIVTGGAKAQVGSAGVGFPVARSFASAASCHSPNGAPVMARRCGVFRTGTRSWPTRGALK
jgi:hypothetical protein